LLFGPSGRPTIRGHSAASGYEQFDVARAEIAATDALIRALEGRGMSKAELARRMSVNPDIVRRLLTDAGGEPDRRYSP
jgi:hypothetical protein